MTIGNSVESIGSMAFASCKNIETVTCLATLVPTTESDAFKDSYVNYTTLIVPGASLQKYKNSEPWSLFGTFKTIEGTTPTKKDVAIIDNCATYSHEEEECKSISYSRDFSNTSWQSLYVPFSMSYDDWKDDFEVAYINDIRQYDDDEDGTADRTEVEVFKLKEGKSIEPNTPYIIKAKTIGEKTITLEDATLYQTQENTYEVTSNFTRFNFIGTYHTVTDMATKGYYAMADGALKQATSDAVTLQPFRWYLSVTDRNGNPVSLNSKSMSIVFDDGEATGMETINNEAKESSSVHTLTGISKGNDMKNLAPGIYIKNGKKFIVK